MTPVDIGLHLLLNKLFYDHHHVHRYQGKIVIIKPIGSTVNNFSNYFLLNVRKLNYFYQF